MFQDTGKIIHLKAATCLTDADYDCILEEIVLRDKIEFEREVDVYVVDSNTN